MSSISAAVFYLIAPGFLWVGSSRAQGPGMLGRVKGSLATLANCSALDPLRALRA